MPLEVTPVPFVGQQLPYNPKFVREPDMPGSGEGSLQGGGGGSMVSGPGPYAAAASALIGPTPGGVAGPHNAIPALPDAGYTAPGIRIGGLGLDLQGGSSARSSISDGYGPMGGGQGMGQGYMGQGSMGQGSMMDMGQGSMGHGHGPMMGGGMSIGGHARSGFAPDQYGGRAPGPAMSTISSHSWAPESNFLAPRRTSHPGLVPSMAESTIAPRGVSQQRGQAIDPRHQLDVPPPHAGHGHGHHSEHHAHRHAHHHGRHTHRHDPDADADDWDTKSDASYYARPKPTRARSSSIMSDTTSTSATIRPSLPHHHSPHRGSPGQHDHSPISPSPLTRDLPHGHPHSHSHNQAPSPLSPRAHSSVRHARQISGLAGDGGNPPPLPSPYKKVTPLAPESDYAVQEPRALREGSERGNRRNSISHGSIDEHAHAHGHGRRRLASPHGYASDDEGRYSSRSRSGHRDKSRHRQEDLGLVNQSVYSSSSRRQPKHLAEAYPDEDLHGRQHEQEHEHERERGQGYGHSHSRSLSRVPPPLPYRAPSPAQAATLQVPHSQHLMPDIGGLSISGEQQGRRRAHSMQPQPQTLHPTYAHSQGGLPISSSASLAGFGGGGGAGGVGGVGPGYASGPYQTPSMVGGGDAYDDGASVAGSAMTFMDGTVAGRTSHYGLPKYPHQAKPDYRRFMVQRGKADVYLD